MIKGILRIALISTVIFFTAQLGWSFDSDSYNDSIGKSQGSATAAGTTAIGADPTCVTGTCHKNTVNVAIGANTAATSSNIQQQQPPATSTGGGQ